MAEIQEVRAVFIEPQVEGAEGLWLAEDPTREGCLQIFPHSTALGGFGISRAAVARLHSELGLWLYSEMRELPVSDRLAWDGVGFVLREEEEAPPLVAKEDVIDLMEALRASLAIAKKPEPKS